VLPLLVDYYSFLQSVNEISVNLINELLDLPIANYVSFRYCYLPLGLTQLNFLGWINSFLSWEAFEPLAKLSYNIYLVHFSVIYVLSARDSFTAAISNILVVRLFRSEIFIYPIELISHVI